MIDAKAILDNLKRWPISIIPEASIVTEAELKGRFGDTPLVVCDFYVEEMEKGIEVPGGYERHGITNIDHHAPTERMMRRISSGNLAIEYVQANGPVQGKMPVVIHHLDCDSVVSSAIAQGILPPLPELGAAVIAADHTGETNILADMLQGLERARDYDLSITAIAHYLQDQEITPEALPYLNERLEERRVAQRAVDNGVFKTVEGVTYGTVPERIDGVFLPSLLPDAKVILIAKPTPHDAYPWVYKLRLGLAAPPGWTLHNLRLNEIDPGYGGRWNAGGDRRFGGCTVTPEDFARKLAQRLPH